MGLVARGIVVWFRTWAVTHLKQRLSASAAAVPSSRREALATSMPVRSATMVWKFKRLSSRPWAISGWYGVYWVVL